MPAQIRQHDPVPPLLAFTSRWGSILDPWICGQTCDLKRGLQLDLEMRQQDTQTPVGDVPDLQLAFDVGVGQAPVVASPLDELALHEPVGTAPQLLALLGVLRVAPCDQGEQDQSQQQPGVIPVAEGPLLDQELVVRR